MKSKRVEIVYYKDMDSVKNKLKVELWEFEKSGKAEALSPVNV